MPEEAEPQKKMAVQLFPRWLESEIPKNGSLCCTLEVLEFIPTFYLGYKEKPLG